MGTGSDRSHEGNHCKYHISALFPAIFGKGPWPKLGKMMDLTSKLGEINGIEKKTTRVEIYP